MSSAIEAGVVRFRQFTKIITHIPPRTMSTYAVKQHIIPPHRIVARPKLADIFGTPEIKMLMRNPGFREIPGFPTTLSYPDPKANTLTIRGANIKELKDVPFDDVIFLLLTGKKAEEVPEQASQIREKINGGKILNEQEKEIVSTITQLALKSAKEPDILSLTNSILSIFDAVGRTFHSEKKGITEEFIEDVLSKMGRYIAVILHIEGILSEKNVRIISPSPTLSFEHSFFNLIDPKLKPTKQQLDLLRLVLLVQISNGVNHGAGLSAAHSTTFGGEPLKSATERLNTPKHGFANIECSQMAEKIKECVRSGMTYKEAAEKYMEKGTGLGRR